MIRITKITVLTLYATACILIALADCSLVTPQSAGDCTINIPILLFHHLADESTNSMVITPQHFESVLKTLKEAGCTTITPEQLVAYVDGESDLPENSVLITFDDGYESNVLLAAPLLREYDMCATAFVIGVSVGKGTYKDTGIPITPHFSWEQAIETSDVLSVQSHTFDMHHTTELDTENYRYGVLQREGECDADYKNALVNDYLKFEADIKSGMNHSVIAFAYPYGQYSQQSESILKELGVRMTFLGTEGENSITPGNVDSLFSLRRKSINPDTTAEELLEYLIAAYGG